MKEGAKLLQALDAVQEVLQYLPDYPGDRAEPVRQALDDLDAAPWSLLHRDEAAKMHDRLSQLRNALLRIEQDPESDTVLKWIDEGRWAADELEHDLRDLLTPHSPSRHHAYSR